LTREARDYDSHLPWSHRMARSPHGAALGLSIVLSQATNRVWGGADVEAGVADGGAEEITAVECWNRTIERH
jgi:hypothetical protein